MIFLAASQIKTIPLSFFNYFGRKVVRSLVLWIFHFWIDRRFYCFLLRLSSLWARVIHHFRCAAASSFFPFFSRTWFNKNGERKCERGSVPEKRKKKTMGQPTPIMTGMLLKPFSRIRSSYTRRFFLSRSFFLLGSPRRLKSWQRRTSSCSRALLLHSLCTARSIKFRPDFLLLPTQPPSPLWFDWMAFRHFFSLFFFGVAAAALAFSSSLDPSGNYSLSPVFI